MWSGWSAKGICSGNQCRATGERYCCGVRKKRSLWSNGDGSCRSGLARRLMEGLGDEELRIFYHCLTVLGQNVEDVRKNGIETEE